MPFFGQSRGVALSSRRPRVLKTGDKMGLPWNAYYVLTKANAALTNSKIHPNSGAPNYDITHNSSDLADWPALVAGQFLSNDGTDLSWAAGGGGVTDHSALNELNWADAGHTFDANLDIGAFDLITTGNFSDGVNALTIAEAKTAFDHVSITVNPHSADTRYLELDGSNANTDIDIGAYDFTTTGTGTFGTVNLTDNSQLIQVDGAGFLANDGTENLRFGVGTSNGDLAIENTFIGYRAGYNNDDSHPIGDADGSRNVYIGNRAGYGETPGSPNSGGECVAVGSRTLRYNTIGYENTAVGDEVLQYNTTGNGNTGLGNDAMQGRPGFPITGNFNTGIGVDSLYILTSGSYNTAIGYQNLYALTTGNYNVALGYQTGYALTEGVSNVFVGYRAGYNQTTSSNDVILGYRAGYNNNGDATLGDNVFVGYQSFYNSNGRYNIGIGFQSGYYNHTTIGGEGTNNVYIGNEAGKGADAIKNTGYRNMAIGFQAMFTNQSGFNNVAFGGATLKYNTTGFGNVAIGDTAMVRNISGSKNVAIGNGALYNSTGSQNLVVGADAGSNQTSGHYNTLVGSETGKYNITGDKNTCIGYKAGMGSVGNSNSNNTFIGTVSGGSVTTGHNNVFVGYLSGRRQTTNSNLLIIDNQDRGSAADEATNAILYGVMTAAPASQTLALNASVFLSQVKAGATQGGAGAAANEVWKTSGHASLPDNVLMIGV